MSNQQGGALKSAHLPVAIYLNQRLIFDLLAVFEDGFAQVERIETSRGGASNAEVSGSLGVGNPFALIGLKLRGDAKSAKATTETQVRTEEVVHTPTSLAARLSGYLTEHGLVRAIAGPDDLDRLAPGDFVEFAAVIRRSPLSETIASLRDVASIYQVFEGASKPPQSVQRKGPSGRTPEPSAAQLGKMVDALAASVGSGDSYDLVASVLGTGAVRAVLTAERSFFVDPTLNNLLDGTFRVLAKVTRVLPAGSTESISLVRKSSLGKLAPQLIGEVAKQLQDAFPVAGQRDELFTEVTTPALQAIPILVYA